MKADGGRRYLCGGCGSLTCGVAVLRRLVGHEVAQHLWAAAWAADRLIDTLKCPFCGNHLASSPGCAGTAAICRACEMVYLDKEAIDALSHPAPAADLASALAAARCPNCGAPLEHGADDKCSYCGALLEVVRAAAGGTATVS